VSFAYYQDNPTRQENNTVTLTPSQKLVVQRNALNELGLAFSNYSVRVGEGHQGTNTVFVAGEFPQPQNGVAPCGETNSLSYRVSFVYYLINMEQAQWALNLQVAQPTQDILQAIGEGIGNNAAHEIGHQLTTGFTPAGEVVGGMGMDDASQNTYNGASCNGATNPWVFTGVGTDGQTPIHWGTNADQSLTNILGKKN
jgi:hypothetical protein